jgi:hypothetical protein
VQSAAQNIPGFVASVLTGTPEFALNAMSVLSAGQAVQEGLAKGATPEANAIAAATTGMIEKLTEILPARQLFKWLKGETGIRGLATMMGEEVVGEQLATLGQDLAAWLRDNPEGTAKAFKDTYLAQRPEAAYQTLIATLVGTALQTGVVRGAAQAITAPERKRARLVQRQMEDARKATAAEVSAERMDALAEKASSTKVQGLDPASFRTFLQGALGAEEDVLLTAHDAATLLQSAPAIMETLREKAPETAGAVAGAIGTGEMVHIPVADYLTYLTPFHEQMRDLLRSDVDGMSVEEAQAWQKDRGKAFQKESQKIEAEHAKDQAFQQSADQVEAAIRDQVLATGRFLPDVAEKYAALHRAFAVTFADRLGVMPHEIAQRYGVQVQAGAPGGPGVLEQPVYHGTSHVFAPEPGFPHGRPRLDKIGTGEGAQAYGWGWYSAEAEGTAKFYKADKFANEDKYVVSVGGDVVNNVAIRKSVLSARFARGRTPTIDEVVKKAKDFAKISGKGDLRSAPQFWKDAVSELEDAKASGKTIGVESPGNIYTLDLPDDVLPKLLDWDKPLGEQPNGVREALESVPGLIESAKRQEESPKGSTLYYELQNIGLAENDEQASKYLASLGIPGLQYLDQGSRATGEGTRNFVIWDQKTHDRMALLERNGEKLDAIRTLNQPPSPVPNAPAESPPPAAVEPGAGGLKKSVGDTLPYLRETDLVINPANEAELIPAQDFYSKSGVRTANKTVGLDVLKKGVLINHNGKRLWNDEGTIHTLAVGWRGEQPIENGGVAVIRDWLDPNPVAVVFHGDPTPKIIAAVKSELSKVPQGRQIDVGTKAFLPHQRGELVRYLDAVKTKAEPEAGGLKKSLTPDELTQRAFHENKNSKNNDRREYYAHAEMVPVDELTRFRDIDRSAKDKAPGALQALEEQIKKNGINDIAILTYGQKSHTAILSEGNTRLAAAKRLGIKSIPVRVVRYNEGSGPIRGPGSNRLGTKVPGVEPNKFGYVPGDMSPSEIGIRIEQTQPGAGGLKAEHAVGDPEVRQSIAKEAASQAQPPAPKPAQEAKGGGASAPPERYLHPVRLSDVDSPAQGNLKQALAEKKKAWARLKVLRQKLKKEPIGGDAAGIRLKIIDAKTKHHEWLQMEHDARAEIEARANELGQTTKKKVPLASRQLKADEQPDILNFIRSHGGIKLDKNDPFNGEITQLNREGALYKKKGHAGLIRRNGKGLSADVMAQALQMDGFHPGEDYGAVELIEDIRDALGGEKVYPITHDYEAEIEAWVAEQIAKDEEAYVAEQIAKEEEAARADEAAGSALQRGAAQPNRGEVHPEEDYARLVDRNGATPEERDAFLSAYRNAAPEEQAKLYAEEEFLANLGGEEPAPMRTEPTPAGDQGLIPGTEGRTFPDEKITTDVPQATDHLLPEALPPEEPKLDLGEELDSYYKNIDKPKPPEKEPPPGDSMTMHGGLSGIVKGYRRNAERIARNVHKTLDPFERVNKAHAVKVRRNLLMGDRDRVGKMATRVYDMFRKAAPADQDAALAYLTDPMGKTTGIKDPVTRKKTEALKRQIRLQGKALVKRGQLMEKQRAHYEDWYLPRLYLKHVLGESRWSALSSGAKLSDLGYTKSRDPNLPEDVRKVILGQIEDPGYLLAHAIAVQGSDIVTYDYLADLAAMPGGPVAPRSFVPIIRDGMRVHVVPPDTKGAMKVTPWWLKDEEERLSVQANYMDDPEAGQARSLAKQYGQIADRAFRELNLHHPKGYYQIPDTRRYGPLRGMWVQKTIHQDIVGDTVLTSGTGEASTALKLWNAAEAYTAFFKWVHVAANLPTQVRNFGANAIMAHTYGGVPLPLVPVRYAQALNEMIHNGPHWGAAKRRGVLRMTLSAQELGRIKKDYLRRNHTHNPFMAVADLGAAIYNVTGDVYSLSEALGKTAIVIDQMKRKGANADDAVVAAHKALFDYSAVPTSVKVLRRSPIGSPFMTFYYKTTAEAIEMALLHPYRMIPWYAMMAGTVFLTAWEYKTAYKEIRKLYGSLADWLQNRGGAVPLPHPDKNGRFQWVDVGYYLPWQQPVAMLRALGNADVQEFIEQTGVMGGPVPSLYEAIAHNVDNFTHRPIYNKDDPPEKQISDWVSYAWRLNAPTMLTEYGIVSPPGVVSDLMNITHGEHSGKLIQALKGYENPSRLFYKDPPLTVSQALWRLVGVNIYPIDPKKSRMFNLNRMDRELEDLDREYGRLRSNPNIGDDRNLSMGAREKRSAARDRLDAWYKAKRSALIVKRREYSNKSKIDPAILNRLNNPTP